MWPTLAVTLIYPYAKRHVSMPQAVLGVAFSFGIPMAFVAVQGSGLTAQQAWQGVPPLAWALLLGNLFWVLAYDTEYAMVDRCGRAARRRGAHAVDGGGAGGLAFRVDPQTRAGAVFFGLSHEPLAGCDDVCRHRAGLCVTLAA